MGNKNRISSKLLDIMLATRNKDQAWVEPFVGGANMIDKVSGIRIGNDSHEYLISMWKALQNGWIPPSDVSRDMYYAIKRDPNNYYPELVGFVGFLCSFAGKWWGGYAFDSAGNNYAARGVRVLLKQIQNLKDVKFTSGNYSNINLPKNSLIYCDPPYAGTTKYRDKFDHESFYQWCRDKYAEGHAVFISEYNMPDDFECILEVTHNTILNKNDSQTRIERLFKCI